MEKAYRLLKLLILVLLLAVLIVGAYVLYGTLTRQVETPTAATAQTETQSNPAPDFTFYDQEGDSHTLSEFQGKPVILNFWATWCGFCKREMPLLQSAYDTYADQLHIVMMDCADGRQEKVEAAAAYLQQQGYTFPAYYDTSMSGTRAYGIMGIPATFFIDEDGNLVNQILGMLTEESLQHNIDALLE